MVKRWIWLYIHASYVLFLCLGLNFVLHTDTLILTYPVVGEGGGGLTFS